MGEICAKVAACATNISLQNFTAKFRQTSSTPSGWLKIEISPLLSKLAKKSTQTFLVQSFSTTLRVMDVRTENRGRPHRKVRFPAAPLVGRNFLTPGHPGVRVRNVRGKSGPKSLCLCCFFFPESKLRRVHVGRFQHPATLLQRHSQTHELVDTLPHRPLLGGLLQDLVYLSEVDRIFNLGRVGPCSTLDQYGYRGKISSGQWTCPSVSSKAKMRVTEKISQNICCHKHLKTEL